MATTTLVTESTHEVLNTTKSRTFTALYDSVDFFAGWTLYFGFVFLHVWLFGYNMTYKKIVSSTLCALC
jgi:hypothetical protein